MIKKWFVLITMVILVLVTTQCAPATPEQPTATPVPKLKIAMVLPGPITDQGFNAAGKAGLDALAKEFDAETAYSDAVAQTDFVETYRDYANQGYNIIIGHGNQFNDAAMTVMKEFPKTFFIVMGGQDAPGGNYLDAAYHEAEATFIPGFIAAKMSKTGKIAAIGGFDFPGIIAQLEGFRQGALYANPNIKVDITYIGTFEDVAKAKEAALAQIDAGADVVFHIVDNAGVGIFEAVKERNVYGVGFSGDQSSFAPDNVITSEMINFGALYGAAVREILSGRPIKAEVYRFGYEANPSPIMHADTALVPDDIKAEAKALEAKLGSGEVKTELIFTK